MKFIKSSEETLEMLKRLAERHSIVDFETIDGGFRIWPLVKRGQGPEGNPDGCIDLNTSEACSFIMGIETIEYRMSAMFRDNPDIAEMIMERSIRQVLKGNF